MTPIVTAMTLCRVVSSPSTGSFDASHRPLVVTGRAERLRDRGVDEVGADGGAGRDPEHRDQDRGHERPGAHAGEAHEEPDSKPCDRQSWIHHSSLIVPTIPYFLD